MRAIRPWSVESERRTVSPQVDTFWGFSKGYAATCTSRSGSHQSIGCCCVFTAQLRPDPRPRTGMPEHGRVPSSLQRRIVAEPTLSPTIRSAKDHAAPGGGGVVLSFLLPTFFSRLTSLFGATSTAKLINTQMASISLTRESIACYF